MICIRLTVHATLHSGTTFLWHAMALNYIIANVTPYNLPIQLFLPLWSVVAILFFFSCLLDLKLNVAVDFDCCVSEINVVLGNLPVLVAERSQVKQATLVSC